MFRGPISHGLGILEASDHAKTICILSERSRALSTSTESLANIGNIQGSVHNFRDWCCPLYSNCSSAMQWYVIVLAYLGSQCTKFYSAGYTCWFFTPFYSDLCIWHDEISRWIRQRNSIRFCANPRKNATETLAMISQNTTSRMHLKNIRSVGKGAYVRKRTTSRVMVASRPKIKFWPDGNTSLGNYGSLFVVLYLLFKLKLIE
jgi:hypothetical protein